VVSVRLGSKMKTKGWGYYKPDLKNNINRDISKSTTGAASELFVSADLLCRGFDVFRAVSPCCSCDLIAVKGKLFLRIEVKTGRIFNEKIIFPSIKGKMAERYDILAICVNCQKIIYKPELPMSFTDNNL